MKKAAFLTQKGPKAVGPYSTAFCVDNLIFLSGMIPINPASGKIEAADVEGQARQVLENLSTVLAEMGLTLGGENHRVHDRSGGFWPRERHLRGILPRTVPRALVRAGGRAAHGRADRNRGHRGAAGIAGQA